MSSLTRNLLSSAVERVISTLLTLIVLPFQVRILGMEAYGVLGFVASLQVLFNILDLGLGPTVIREMSGDITARRPETRAVVQTLSSVYWAIAGVLGLLVAVGAPWIATRWLHAQTLPITTIIVAIRLIALSVLLRWPVSLYAGLITGAQRLDVVNAIRIGISVLKLLAGLVVLVVSRSLVVYLTWLVFVGFVEVSWYVAATVRVLPDVPLRGRFSGGALRQIWRFSLHMNIISVVAVLLVQGDRIVISRLLPIAELGFYSVAYAVVTGLSMIQNVVTTALYPALAHQVALGQTAAILHRCRNAVQLLMYVVSGAAGVLIFYGSVLLQVWISKETAARSAPPMAVLAFAFTLAAAVAIPYTLSIAAGKTVVPLILNLLALVVYVPAVFWLVRTWGITGAAWASVGLYGYYLVVLVPLLQRQIPMEPLGRWFFRNVLPFVMAALVLMGGSRFLSVRYLGNDVWVPFAAMTTAVAAYAALGFALLDSDVRSRAGFRLVGDVAGTPVL